MPDRAALRAADADRDLVAERLRTASAEGRLLTDELEQRLDAALRARTYGALEALVADLPGPRLLARREPRPLRWAGPALGLAVAVPVALIVLAIAVFAITGVIAGWCLWLALAWWFFGARRHRHARFGGCAGMRSPRRRPHSTHPV